jgi:hypothetical protein
MKKKIKVLLMGGSSTCSAALPIGTCPRLLIFLSNLLLRLRRLRGAGCVLLVFVGDGGGGGPTGDENQLQWVRVLIGGNHFTNIMVKTIRQQDNTLPIISKIIHWISSKAISVNKSRVEDSRRRGHNSNFYSTPHSRGGRIMNTDQSCNN